MTEQHDFLPALAEIIAGWERAEGIRVLHAWVTDAGIWQVEWTERKAKGTLRGGETIVRVSRLIADIKEVSKTHGVTLRHIAHPGPDAVRAWTADGIYLRWDAPATGRTRKGATVNNPMSNFPGHITSFPSIRDQRSYSK